MAKVSAQIQPEKYVVKIDTPTGNSILSDQKEEAEGNDLGLDPKELLSASLAACTTVTLRMYVDHKGWDVQDINVEVSLEYLKEENITKIHSVVNVIGNLDEKQRARILSVAKSCPVHKILTNPIEIQTE